MSTRWLNIESVRVFCDRQDWLGRRTRQLKVRGGLVQLPTYSNQHMKRFPLTFEAWCVQDELTASASIHVPLINLVDSEVWLFGRTQSVRFGDGTTLRERLLAWERGEVPPDSSVFHSPDEFDHVFLTLPANAKEHIERFWLKARRNGTAFALIWRDVG